MSKVMSLEQAVAMVQSGDVIVNSGFLTSGTPDYLIQGITDAFEKTGAPNNLTVYFGAGQGDRKGGQQERWAKKGLIKRWVGGHYGFSPKVVEMIANNEVEAYNLPQGVIVEMCRAIGQNRKGYITNVGLETYVDPRIDGG